jgi:drug/metabolite transporter (DMT)-like permease
MLDSRIKGYSQVASASILFGLIGIFVKLIRDMPLGSIIFYRLLFALVIILFYFTCCGRLSELRLKEKKIYILLLGLSQAGTMLAYFFSIKYTAVSTAVLLLYTAPIYVTVLSPLMLQERITRHSLFALIMSMTGVIMVIQPHSVFQDLGDKYIIGLTAGLASGLFYAALILTSRYLKDYYTGRTQATWALFITMAIFSPYSGSISGGVLQDNLFILILFGIMPTAMALVLYLSGLVYVKAQNASVIGLLEPVSSVVLAFIILSESISSVSLLGGVLILLAALITSRDKPTAKSEYSIG